MLRVLIVDDSPTICSILRSILMKDSRFEVCGIAENGLVAVELARTLVPDLIVMDINMPLLDGISATKKIMEDFAHDRQHTPAVVSFTTEDAADMGFRCLEAGAIEMIRKPELRDMNETYLKDFCDRLYLITTMHRQIKKEFSVPLTEDEILKPSGNFSLLLIGASTGGPGAVQKVLSGLGKDFPVPICVTQHIDNHFDKQFANWLNSTCDLTVKLAENEEPALPGTVYVAPADYHLAFRRNSSQFSLILNQDEPLYFLRPSVDKMFFSAVENFGSGIMAVLLTGMGQDGAKGCRKIVDAGGFTICEDESTCVVYGMPKAAVAEGGASRVLPLDDISDFVSQAFKGED